MSYSNPNGIRTINPFRDHLVLKVGEPMTKMQDLMARPLFLAHELVLLLFGRFYKLGSGSFLGALSKP